MRRLRARRLGRPCRHRPLVLSTARLRYEGAFLPELLLGRFSDGALAVASIARQERDPARVSSDLMRLGRTGADGRIEVFATATGIRRFGRGPVPFSPYLRAFLRRDTLYFTDGVRDISAVDADGALARTIEMPLPAITEADARAELAALLAAPERQRPPIGDLEDVPVEESVPRASLVLLDDAGRFWLQRYRPALDSPWGDGPPFGTAGGGSWLVLDPNGRPVARLEMPDGFVPYDIVGDRVLGVVRDELDVPRIAIYEIVRD